MAFVLDPRFSANINFCDAGGRKASMGFSFVKSESATEPAARAKLLALATALQAVSCALVQSTVLRLGNQDNTIEIEPPETGEGYPVVEDKAKFGILPVDQDKKVDITLPAPKEAVFLPGSEVVDQANAAVQEVVTALVGWAVDYGKNAALRLIDGYRERGRIRKLPYGGVPQLP